MNLDELFALARSQGLTPTHACDKLGIHTIAIGGLDTHFSISGMGLDGLIEEAAKEIPRAAIWQNWRTT